MFAARPAQRNDQAGGRDRAALHELWCVFAFCDLRFGRKGRTMRKFLVFPGLDDHKTWECPDQQNITAKIICLACGGTFLYPFSPEIKDQS